MVALEKKKKPSGAAQLGASARLSTEAVRVVAQSIPNLPPLTEAAASALAPDAEYRVREIIQDSLKFMKHSKRSRLMPNDVRSALRLRNVEPIYGFSTMKRMLTSDDTKSIAGFRDGSSELTSIPPGTRVNTMDHVKFKKVDGLPDLYVFDDAEESVKTILELPMPKLPLEVTVSSHWLAVDGIQPVIAQNPTKRAKTRPPADGPGVSGSEADLSVGRPSTEVKPVLRHDLTREQQLYLEEVTRSLQGEDGTIVRACLDSVAEESGLVQLLPYFTVFINNSVSSSLRNLPRLTSLMRLVDALLRNTEFNIETYLHQLLPSILSCVVGKRLCANPRDNHWALRDYAAGLIRRICERYGTTYAKLQPRITKTFVDALQDSKRPLTTHYGAIVGTASLGRQVVDVLLRPRLGKYAGKVKKLLLNPKQKDIRRFEASKVFGAMIWALSVPEAPRNEVSEHTTTPTPFPNHRIGSSGVVQKKRLSEVIPDAESLCEALRQELGSQLYPYGKPEQGETVAKK